MTLHLTQCRTHTRFLSAFYSETFLHHMCFNSDPLDIDDGLYNFLSPQLIIRSDEGATAGPVLGDGATQDSMGVELPRPPSMLSMPDKPEWFQKGTVYTS